MCLQHFYILGNSPTHQLDSQTLFHSALKLLQQKVTWWRGLASTNITLSATEPWSHRLRSSYQFCRVQEDIRDVVKHVDDAADAHMVYLNRDN